MRLGIAHHFGWAVAVTAADDHRVVDRRRIELLEPGVPAAPIHHDSEGLDDDAAAALVAAVRASAVRATTEALDELAASLPGPIVSMSLRAWPLDFPGDIAVQRRVPYEARADSVMYRQVLAEVAQARGWAVVVYDAATVEARGGEPPRRAGPGRAPRSAEGCSGRRGARTSGWRSPRPSWRRTIRARSRRRSCCGGRLQRRHRAPGTSAGASTGPALGSRRSAPAGRSPGSRSHANKAAARTRWP